MIGQRFGMLVVIRKAPSYARRIRFRCICDCGRTSITYGHMLRSGHTRSCGCNRFGRKQKGMAEAFRNLSRAWAAERGVYLADAKAA